MNGYAADLHVHTALSPCASPEMTPPAIVREAVGRGLAAVAICDHNAARNTRAVRRAAGARLLVVAGIEITTAEEIHVLGLFPDDARAEAVGRIVGDALVAPRFPAPSNRQRVMDASGATVDWETAPLSSACSLPLSRIADLIARHDGLVVAAHADRPAFSVLSQLGLFPADVRFDAIEVTGRPDGLPSGLPGDLPGGVPRIASSDSHALADLGKRFTVFEVREATFAEFALALVAAEGRRCWIA
jgi:PHP family Zn ribbon phosphoesterase